MTTAALHLSKSEFDGQVRSSETPALIEFGADWCAPCRRVAPILDELAADYAGRVVVAKVDVDAESELAREQGIGSIPTFLFVRDGEEVDRVSGALAKAQIAEKLEALVGDA